MLSETLYTTGMVLCVVAFVAIVLVILTPDR